MKQLERRLQALESRIGTDMRAYPIHGLSAATLGEIDQHGFNVKRLSSPALQDILDHAPKELTHA